VQHTLQRTATHCNTLQHTATLQCRWAGAAFKKSVCFKTLQYTPQHTAAHGNILQHTATHCNTLQHTATHCNIVLLVGRGGLHTAKHSTTMQHTAKHYITLQLTATYYNILQVVCAGSIQNVFVCSTLQ